MKDRNKTKEQLIRELTELQRRMNDFEVSEKDREWKEEVLRMSEARYRGLFNSSMNAIAVYEAIGEGEDFIIKDFNRAGEQIENVRREDLIGRKVTEVFPAVKDFGLLQVLRRVWKTGEPEGHPVSFYQDDRIAGWRENDVYKLPSGEVVAIYEDVTDRKRAEEALRQSEERYRNLFEGSKDAIYTTTREGKILEVNQSMLNLFGYSREEMIGLHTRDTYVDPEDRLKFRKEIEQQGFVKDFEVKLLKKDGTEMECLLTSVVSRAADGNIAGYQGIIRDITERKRAEEAREKLIHQLQDALTNIKTLRGLLPICASCKRIRDDKGYWNQIESYIGHHSEAEFSHGICPECMKKYYPDFVDNEE